VIGRDKGEWEGDEDFDTAKGGGFQGEGELEATIKELRERGSGCHGDEIWNSCVYSEGIRCREGDERFDLLVVVYRERYAYLYSLALYPLEGASGW
jgi:hypothetical protein